MKRGKFIISPSFLIKTLPFIKSCSLVYDISYHDSLFTYYAVHPDFDEVEEQETTPEYTIIFDALTSTYHPTKCLSSLNIVNSPPA